MDKISSLKPAEKSLVLANHHNNQYIFVKKANRIRKVDINEIIYISVEERYCNLITLDEKFTIQISLTQIMDFFEPYNFIRTHRNSIINPNKIKEIILSENIITLEGNHSVVLSNNYKDFLSKQIIF